MHKKDIVKKVIEKYVDKGMDFFELTPGYLVTLDELKGFSERTLKRGRTEYKNENKNQLKGRSKAGLNLKKKVLQYLEENPKTSLSQLKKKFASQEPKLLSEAHKEWKKGVRTSATPKKKTEMEEAGSLRQKVFKKLEENPEITLSKLETFFQAENKKTISNYLDQWRKEKTEKGKKISTKQMVHNYLDQHPEIVLKALKEAFPEINPSSIGAYHSLWKNNQPQTRGNKKAAKPSINKASVPVEQVLSVRSANQIIDALNNTVEAQKKTIEILKSQNELLEEKQAHAFPELKGMSKKEIEKFERVMSTFLKGLRKS